jgi:hypothetical protein
MFYQLWHDEGFEVVGINGAKQVFAIETIAEPWVPN